MQGAPTQTAAPPGGDNTLVALARTLSLPKETVQMVEKSGCETPADWVFALLEKPENGAEALLWDAVQSAGALDVGAMMVIAAQASAKRRQVQTVKPAGCVKTLGKLKHKHPFRGAKK